MKYLIFLIVIALLSPYLSSQNPRLPADGSWVVQELGQVPGAVGPEGAHARNRRGRGRPGAAGIVHLRQSHPGMVYQA